MLVYYDKRSVNGDDILGFVDLRKATQVNEARKVDYFAMGDAHLTLPQSVNKKEERVVEIKTSTRTYLLCPESVNKVRGIDF